MKLKKKLCLYYILYIFLYSFVYINHSERESDVENSYLLKKGSLQTFQTNSWTCQVVQVELFFIHIEAVQVFCWSNTAYWCHALQMHPKQFSSFRTSRNMSNCCVGRFYIATSNVMLQAERTPLLIYYSFYSRFSGCWHIFQRIDEILLHIYFFAVRSLYFVDF